MPDKPVFDEAWYDDYCRRRGIQRPDMGRSSNRPIPQADEPAPKRTKYGNRKTQRHGRMFDSKHEADVYDELILLAAGGEISGFGCQVPFWLPGGVKYIADFVALHRDGSYSVIDAKSVATRKDKTYRLKRRLMKECLGIEIEER